MERVIAFVLVLASTLSTTSSLSEEVNECKRKCLEQRIKLEQLCYKRTEGEDLYYCLRGVHSVHEKCVAACNVSAAP